MILLLHLPDHELFNYKNYLCRHTTTNKHAYPNTLNSFSPNADVKFL